LFKFAEGQADKSHGIVVAKMAGIPKNVLDIAKRKEKMITKEKRNISFEKNLVERFNKAIEELEKVDSGKVNSVPILNHILVELNQL